MKKHVFSKVSLKFFSTKWQTIVTKMIVNRTCLYVLSKFQILVTKDGGINDTKAFVLDKMGPICHIMGENYKVLFLKIGSKILLEYIRNLKFFPNVLFDLQLNLVEN